MMARKVSALLPNCKKLLSVSPPGCVTRQQSSEEEPIEETGINYEKSINSVTLLGRVGDEAQKRGSDVHPVVIFSLATHNNYRQNTGEVQQKTDWHRICVFRPGLRDVVYNYLRKGQRVHITGRLSYGSVKDESGSSHTATSIIADEIIFFQAPNKQV